jgi:DGQHR domain-containing protein
MAVQKDKGIKDVMIAMNRPIDPAHAKVTKEYILRNCRSKFILPPMTLNFQDAIDIYTIDLSGAHVTPGFMVVPYGVKFSITDGQHRKKALEDLARENREEYNEIMNNGICVMIVVEDNLSQIHQDFADCSKTKPLPKSLIAVYDKRNPANGLVLDLINECPLFHDKIDATATTLSKNSTKLFLVSQLRSFLKELIMGSSAAGDVDFEKNATDLFVDANTEAYKQALSRFKDIVIKITEKIPILNEVSKFEGLDRNRIPNLRNTYLILNSAGLNIIGRIVYGIWQDAELSKEVDKYLDLLAQIDWRKDADLWQGNIVASGVKGLKISPSNSTLKAAVMKVKQAIGLPVIPVRI